MNVRLPAEWEPQSGLLLTWPHPETDWRDRLTEIEQVFVDIVRHSARQQTVIIACHDGERETHVRKLLQQSGIPANTCRTFIAPSNDTWARDHGPVTILRNTSPVLLDFEFNGWGGKYPARLDNRITRELHKAGAFGQTPLEHCPFVLEGGSIETDGCGTVMVTASCLLSNQRNAGMNKTEIEDKLKQFLGAKRLLWLQHGSLSGDDTDGHIDILARFANRGTIIHIATKDKNNPGYTDLLKMTRELSGLRQLNGKHYELISLPVPHLTDHSGRPLPASYANFSLINGTVLFPLYGVAEDDTALAIIRNCFPGRMIAGINCRSLIEQCGSLHCATMQLPAGVVL